MEKQRQGMERIMEENMSRSQQGLSSSPSRRRLYFENRL